LKDVGTDIIKTWLPNKNFTLLYRASRDGYDANTFHSLCDRKGPTLVVLRTVQNKVIGGYTELLWQKVDNEYGYVPDPNKTTFLFSLTLQHS